MAVADLSLDLTISDQCPDYVFTDNTDYLPVKKRFSFKIHDYLSAPTDGNYTLSQIVVSSLGNPPVLLLNDSIDIVILTGDIVDPEATYQAIIDSIAAAETGYAAVLNKDGSDDFKNWALDISIFVDEDTVDTEDVDVTLAGLTPVVIGGNEVADQAGGGTLIEGRNLNVYDPNGNEIDLGQVAQVDTLTLSRSVYNVGDDIIYDICGGNVRYTVEEGKTEKKCVLEGLYNALKNEPNAFTDTLDIALDGDSITFTAKTKGVPFKGTITTDFNATTYSYTTTTANVSSFALPSNTASNVITYQPAEEGGTYDIVLNVFVACNYKICSYKSNNWCYSLKTIDCCIQELVLQQSCTNCNKIKGLNEKIDLLRANRDAINIMLVDQYSIADINDLVQSSLSVCKKSKCGCK